MITIKFNSWGNKNKLSIYIQRLSQSLNQDLKLSKHCLIFGVNNCNSIGFVVIWSSHVCTTFIYWVDKWFFKFFNLLIHFLVVIFSILHFSIYSLYCFIYAFRYFVSLQLHWFINSTHLGWYFEAKPLSKWKHSKGTSSDFFFIPKNQLSLVFYSMINTWYLRDEKYKY